jgi:hypothetical protein
MANTVIALKKSATPSSAPADLANGELALNYADGKLYYKNTAGFIVEFAPTTSSNYFGTVNANSTLLVADTTNDILTIAPGTNINIVGDAVNDRLTISLANDVVIPGTFKIATVGNDEGGELVLGNAVTNSVLVGDIKIDVYQNRLRFFEGGSPNRGAFINLAAAGASVGTDLLATSSDSTARDWASSAFAKANAALPNTSGAVFNGSLTVSSNLSADRIISTNNGNGENFKVGDDLWIGDTNLADTVRIKGQQNASRAYILFGDNDGIALGRQGSNALTYGANTIWHAGNDGAGSTLDADLLDGQHGSYYGIATDVTAAFAQANTARTQANTSFLGANAALIQANTARDQGNTAFLGANAALIQANTARDQGNTAFLGANAALIQANTARDQGNTAFLGANAALIQANTARDQGNTAFTQANTARSQGNTAFTQANLAFSQANAAFTSSNAVNTYSNSTYVKLTAASQTITGNLNIVGDLTLSGNTFTIDATRLEVDDPLIYLAANNYTSDIVDIGFIGNYMNSTGANVHTGLYREHEDKMYYLFQGYDKEPANNHIGAFSNNMTLAVLNADIKTSNLSLGNVDAISWITAAFNKANAALPNTSGATFNGVLNISNNVTTQGLNVTSNVINFGSAMSILSNGMIMIYGDINMLT